VTWRRIGALDARYDWIAKILGVIFVDPNSWTENCNFGRGGLHLNQCGARTLSRLYSRVRGFGGGRFISNE
jgi:hypothetical protein